MLNARKLRRKAANGWATADDLRWALPSRFGRAP